MTQLIVVHPPLSFSCCQNLHISITIIDGNQGFIISYPYSATNAITATWSRDVVMAKLNQYLKKLPNHSQTILSHNKPYITLYSNKKLAPFIEIYKEKFLKENFSFLTHNCAFAVNFALNYFFPEAQLERNCCYFCKWFCLPFCLCSLCSDWFMSPPGTLSPGDVFKKAVLLQLRYGEQSNPINAHRHIV